MADTKKSQSKKDVTEIIELTLNDIHTLIKAFNVIDSVAKNVDVNQKDQIIDRLNEIDTNNIH